jgi:hypothetical protein
VVTLGRSCRFCRPLRGLGRSWIDARILRIASIKGLRAIGVVDIVLDGKVRVIGAGFRAVETEEVVDSEVEVVAMVIETRI